MILEYQVTSLELSKKLKYLKVKQDSLFYWNELDDINDEGHNVIRIELLQYPVTTSYCESFSAFTVSELGEIIPEWFDSCKRKDGDWMCRYFEKDTDKYHCFFSEKESDARAEMLIYILENGLIDIDHRINITGKEKNTI